MSRFYGWKLLAVCWLILVINLAFPMYGGSVINAHMAEDLQLDRRTLGLIFGAFIWMGGLPGPLVAVLVNRVGARKTLMAGSMLMVAAGLLIVLWARSGLVYGLLFSGVVSLAVLAGGPIAVQACLSQWFDRHKALAIALVLTAPGIGGFIAPQLMEHLISSQDGNWRAGWWLLIATSAASFLLAALFVKDTPTELGQQPDGLAAASWAQAAKRPLRGYQTTEEWTLTEVLRSPTYWMLVFAALGVYAGFSIFLTHGVVHLKDLGLAPAKAAAAFGTALVTILGGNLIAAVVGDRVAPRFLFAEASCVYGAGWLLALSPATPAQQMLFPVLLGVGYGTAFSTLMTLPSRYFGNKPYASLIGLAFAIGTTLGAVGDFGAGYMHDKLGSYAWAFNSVAALCFVGALLAIFAAPPRRNVRPRSTTTGDRAPSVVGADLPQP